jgi:hypothetical protein
MAKCGFFQEREHRNMSYIIFTTLSTAILLALLILAAGLGFYLYKFRKSCQDILPSNQMDRMLRESREKVQAAERAYEERRREVERLEEVASKSLQELLAESMNWRFDDKDPIVETDLENTADAASPSQTRFGPAGNSIGSVESKRWSAGSLGSQREEHSLVD